MKLAWVAALAVAGVYLGGQGHLPWPLWSAALSSALLAAGLLFRRGGISFLAAMGVVALLLGMLRSPLPAEDSPGHLAYHNGRTLTLRAMVAEAEATGQGQQLVLEARSVEGEGGETPVSGVLQAWVAPFPRYTYGDVLLLEGSLQAPRALGDFDYPAYLAQKGIYSVMSYPRVGLLAQGVGNPARAWLYGLRQRLGQGLARSLPEPQASLAQALLLGRRQALPAELRDAFGRTGTAHILAVSGLHVSVLVGMLLPLGAWLWGRRHGYYLAIPLAGVWLYALLSGAGAPVVRAAIMASLFIWGSYLGRPGSTLTALAVAGALMVLVDPAVLGQVSFQLSFLSMMGLVLLAPRLEGGLLRGVRRLVGSEVAHWVRPLVSAAAVSLAAIAFTYPLIALYFQRVSLVGLPATLLLLPALPVVLVTSAATAAFGAVAGPLGQVFSWLAWPWLSYLVTVVRLFSLPPGVAVDTGEVPSWLVLAIYGAVGLGLAAWRGRGAMARGGLVPQARWVRWGLLLSLATVAGLIWGVAIYLPDGRLHVYLLDVGQGDAVLIQAPGRQQVLVDGGPSPQALAQALGRRLPFWDRNIDLVVLTHPEADHLAGLVEVVGRYRVGSVVEGPLGSSSELYREWRQRLVTAGVRAVAAEPGLTISLGRSIHLEVLYPPPEPLRGTGADTNNNSLVIRLRAGSVSFLLPGDLEVVGEDYLLSREVDLTATVLKVAHHGSATSSSPRFVVAVDPRAAAISVGVDNRHGHPSPQVLQGLRQQVGDQLYLTSWNGTVEFVTDGQRLWVRSERPNAGPVPPR